MAFPTRKSFRPPTSLRLEKFPKRRCAFMLWREPPRNMPNTQVLRWGPRWLPRISGILPKRKFARVEMAKWACRLEPTRVHLKLATVAWATIVQLQETKLTVHILEK